MERTNVVRWLVSVFLALSAVSEHAFAQSERVNIPVLAHYVTWHHKRNAFDNSWIRDGVSQVTTTPLLRTGQGPGYDSLDQNVIRAETQLMAANGITPLVSWWGPAGSELEDSGDRFLDKYFGVSEAPPIALLYEATGLLLGVPGKPNGIPEYPFDDSEMGLENTRRFVAGFAHLARYFDDPRYYNRFFRIRGRPVVFHWISRRYRGNFARAADEARRVSGAYFIGAEFNLSRPAGDEYGGTTIADVSSRIKAFDAISNYGIYEPNLTAQEQGHVTGVYLANYVQAVFRWSQWLHENAPDIPLVLPVQFSYADLKGSGNLPLTSTLAEAENQAAVTHELIEKSRASGGNLGRLIVLVSWSEDYEGSAIHPTEEYGDMFLRIAARWFGSANLSPSAYDPPFAP